MPTQDAYLRDLDDSKIETTISGDVVKHLIDEPARSINERRVRREERWVKQKLLGRGTFGAVYLQKRQEVGAGVETFRAVKEIQKCVAPGKKDLEYTREIEAIVKFSHSKYRHCFVNSNGWYEDEDTVYIAMEFIEHGDLRQHLTKALPESQTIQITAQVLEGLEFMHENRFIHRDLKPANIMVVTPTPNWIVKIADFGISKRRYNDATTNLTALGGTLGFVAPEAIGIVPNNSYTFSVDMWSLGAVAYRMLTNNVPFDGLNEIIQYAFGQSSFPRDTEAFGSISKCGQRFIENLMQLNPEKRMCAASATKHPWLACYMEMQSDVTVLSPFTEIGDGLPEQDAETPSSASHPTYETMAIDTDGERTIRHLSCGNYKFPFISDCADESKAHGGERLAVDSTVLLEGPLKNTHKPATAVPSHVLDTEEPSRTPFRTLSRQLSLGVQAEDRKCVSCSSVKFDFKCTDGHVMCTSCYNEELRLSFSNPQNVTYRCCISNSTHSEENPDHSVQPLDINNSGETSVKTDQAVKVPETNEPDNGKPSVAVEQDADFPTATSPEDHGTPFDGSKLRRRPTMEEHVYSERDESEIGDISDDSGVYYEESYDPSLDCDSDASYESEELPARNGTQSGDTRASPQMPACQNCKSTRSPVETLPCRHKICHACLVQFLALSLVSPKFMNITCCDYPLDEIGEQCWRRILIDPRLNAAWEKLKLVAKGWACPRGHPAKYGSPLVTCGSVPVWRQAVKCSVCAPSASVPRTSDSRHLGNANFCLFCSKEVGSGGCKSCDYDRTAWEFISRLKRSGAFHVDWMAEDVRQACKVKRCMNHGETLDYEPLDEYKEATKPTEPETQSQPPPPRPPPPQSNTYTNPTPNYPDHPHPSTQYHPPPRQNPPYYYPPPYPNPAPHPQNFYPNAPPNWAPHYPPPYPTPYYDVQDQIPYPDHPYAAPGYHPEASSPPPVSIISCCYCTGNHAVQATGRMIQCHCGGRMCGGCYGPLGPCRNGCVNLGARYASYA